MIEIGVPARRPAAGQMRRRSAFHRAAERRRARRPRAPEPPRPSPIARLAPPRDERERARRVARVADALVCTIRACPAPGIAPFTWRERAAFAAIVVLEALLVLVLARPR